MCILIFDGGTMKNFTLKLVSKAHEMIHSLIFCDKYKTSEKYFTRLRCMGFVSVMSLCLNFLRKSLQIEIDNFMELTDPELEKPMSKQAFSKARHKISPDAFKELFEMTGQTAAQDDAFGRYKGYRVFAVDGTELQMPKNEEISQIFPRIRGRFFPYARASVLCDVITGLIAHACIDTTEIGERDFALEHLRYFEPYKKIKRYSHF